MTVATHGRRTPVNRGVDVARIGSIMLICAAFVSMLAWTWNRWPDPIIDFGRELYVPWQLSTGKVLYRDVAHFNGPLSAYLNAGLFWLLGVSLRTLVLLNIAIAGAVIVIIWKLFTAGGGLLSATVASLLFITLFMSTQFVMIGNYNWITPYSHELTHGVALSLAALLLVARFATRPRPMFAGLAGLILGLVFLTKPEVFIAVAPVVVGGMIVAARSRDSTTHGRSLVAFVIALFAPALASATLLSLAMPIGQALRGTVGAWTYVFDSRLSSMRFYQANMGVDRPFDNMSRAILQALVYCVLLAPALLTNMLLWRTGARSHGAGTAATAAYLVAMVSALFWFDRRGAIPWHESFRGLAPVMLMLSAVVCWRALRCGMRPRALVRAMLVVFATLVLAKIALASRIHHYGFALALPAMLVVSAVVLDWIPRAMRYRATTFRLAGVTLLCIVTYKHLSAYDRLFRDKPVNIAAQTEDAFHAAQHGAVVNDLLGMLRLVPPDATLAVIPQGVMINYLSGRANPTPYFTLMPPEVVMFGDDRIASAYENNPPDFLIVFADDFGEYGYKTFEDFAPTSAAWFRRHYTPITEVRSNYFSPVKLLRRRSTTPE